MRARELARRTANDRRTTVRKRSWTLIALGIIAAAVGTYAAVGRSANTNSSTPADATVATVRRGDITKSVASTGKVISNLEVDIKCRASGEVTKLPFDISDPVTKGQLLLELDPVDQERDVKRAQASVDQSKARLAEAQKNLELAEADVPTAQKRADAAIRSAEIRSRSAQAKAQRRQQLIKEQLGSAEDAETADVEAASAAADLETARVQAEEIQSKRLTVELRRHEIALAQAQLDADQIALDTSRQQLLYTHVEAPISGVVSARNIQIGTIISSGITNIGGGTTIMTLCDVSRLFVIASVDEADIGKIQLGQDVLITVDAFPSERFGGKVIRIATTGVNTSNVVTFEVKIEITSANKRLLKPMMTANVQIICDQRKSVLVVPEQSVTRSDGKAAVTIAGTGTAPGAERPVVLGLSDSENVEVLQGLQEGDQVIVRKEVASHWSTDQKKSSMPPPPPQ